MSYIPPFLPCLSDKDALHSLIKFFLLKSNDDEDLDNNIKALKKITRVCSNTIDDIVEKEKTPNYMDQMSQNSRDKTSSTMGNLGSTMNKAFKKLTYFSKTISFTPNLLKVLNDTSNDEFKILLNEQIINSVSPNDPSNNIAFNTPIYFTNYHIINIIAKNNVDFILVLKIDFHDSSKIIAPNTNNVIYKNKHILYVKRENNNDDYKIYKIVNNNYYHPEEIMKNNITNKSWWLLNALYPNYINTCTFLQVKYKLLNMEGIEITNTQHNSNYFIPITTYKLYIDLLILNNYDLINLEDGDANEKYNEKILEILKSITITGPFILKFLIKQKSHGNYVHGGNYEKYNYAILYFKEGTDNFFNMDMNKIKKGDYKLYEAYNCNDDTDLLGIIAKGVNISDISEIKYEIINIEEENAQGGGKYNLKTQFKEILGKKMKIYKIANSRKEHVKYKCNIITLAEYRKLMKKKSNSKKVLKAKKQS